MLHCNVMDVIIEGDASSLINLIKSKESSLVPFGHIVEDVKIASVNFRLCN